MLVLISLLVFYFELLKLNIPLSCLDIEAHEMVSISWPNVCGGGSEDSIGCWFRRSYAGKRTRRSYSLADRLEDSSNGRWNQSGFDTKQPMTPLFTENRWNRQEMEAVLSRVGGQRLRARSLSAK